MLQGAQEEIKKATITGEDPEKTRKIRQRTEEGIGKLGEEIAVLEEEQSKVEAEHLQAKLQELERQEQKVAGELEPCRQVYEEAKKTFEEAERVWFAKHAEAQEELRRINMQKAELRPKLDQLAPQATPEPKHSVEDWLQRCRQGEVKSYIQGMDTNLDEAFQQYEQELKAISKWSRRAAVARGSSGEAPSMPDCARHYIRERLNEIIKKSNRGATGDKDVRASGTKRVPV